MTVNQTVRRTIGGVSAVAVVVGAGVVALSPPPGTALSSPGVYGLVLLGIAAGLLGALGYLSRVAHAPRTGAADAPATTDATATTGPSAPTGGAGDGTSAGTREDGSHREGAGTEPDPEPGAESEPDPSPAPDREPARAGTGGPAGDRDDGAASDTGSVQALFEQSDDDEELESILEGAAEESGFEFVDERTE